MSDERVTFKVLGRNIGTATGWDEIGNQDIMLYDFIPNSRFNLPRGDLGVLFEAGLFETYDDDGTVTSTQDMIEVLAGSSPDAA